MQADSKLVLLRCGSVLLAVDQHAADERVQLEILQQQVAAERQQQQQHGVQGKRQRARLLQQRRLQPAVPLTLSSQEAQALALYPQQVASWGWVVAVPPAPGAAAAGSAGGGGTAGGSSRSGGGVLLGATVSGVLRQVPELVGVQLGGLDLQVRPSWWLGSGNCSTAT